MIKSLTNNLILLLLIIGYTTYGQANSNYNRIVAKIDSVSRSENIENCVIKFHRIDSYFDSSTTRAHELTKKEKFSFDGQFMVVGKMYFNLDKLLFFTVREDYIEFCFQGY